MKPLVHQTPLPIYLAVSAGRLLRKVTQAWSQILGTTKSVLMALICMANLGGRWGELGGRTSD